MFYIHILAYYFWIVNPRSSFFLENIACFFSTFLYVSHNGRGKYSHFWINMTISPIISSRKRAPLAGHWSGFSLNFPKTISRRSCAGWEIVHLSSCLRPLRGDTLYIDAPARPFMIPTRAVHLLLTLFLKAYHEFITNQSIIILVNKKTPQQTR